MSGSLRGASASTALVRAAAALSLDGLSVSVYEGLGSLPAFNPDHDREPAPAPVAAFRAAIMASNALLIATPEYAHGVPGALKNALDWIVGSGELMDRAVGCLNPSPHSLFAHPQLIETVSVMSARVVAEASIVVPVAGRKLDPAGILADAGLASVLSSALRALAMAARPVSITDC